MEKSEYLKEIVKYKQEINEYKKQIRTLKEDRDKFIDGVKFEYEEILNKMSKMWSLSQQINLAEMFRSINHDIRNHLLKISFGLEALSKNENVDRRKLHSYFQTVNRDIDTVGTLMDLYAPTSFQISLSNIEDIVSEVSESLYNKDSNSKINIKVNVLRHSLPSLLCCKAEIAMVFNNLISNSHRAIAQKWYKTGKASVKPEGLIAISLDYSDSDKSYHLSIKDNGIGIDKEFVHKIWEPGFTTYQEGLGLGLYFVKQVLMDNYCGTISVSSSLNDGTTFKVSMKNHVGNISSS